MKTYRINEIFYSLQGEGRNTGRAAVFVRFAGCNLRCAFCDTAFDSYTEMTGEEIIEKVSSLHSSPLTPPFGGAEGWGAFSPPFGGAGGGFIVLTGGEPTLQVDEAFVDLLHSHGYEVAMESNGTRPAPRNLDWLTVSPKNGDACKVKGGGRLPDEIKIVFDEDTDPESFLLLEGQGEALLYLQPCDTGDAERNRRIVAACVDYIKHHPQWRLSLQTHKLIGID